jgi:hypothetical protein
LIENGRNGLRLQSAANAHVSSGTLPTELCGEGIRSAYMVDTLSSAFCDFFLSFSPILLFGMENAHSFVPALTFSPARARKIGQ